jgi:hypothetical protein
MSIKSRGNWKTGICLKSDCTNRDKKCDQCVRFSEYTGEKKEEPKSETPKKLKVSLYDMPLDKYCERKRGNKMIGKGSWPRSVDPKGEDFGEAGCKQGKGIWHPMIKVDFGMKEVCKYCGNTKEEIKKIQES